MRDKGKFKQEAVLEVFCPENNVNLLTGGTVKTVPYVLEVGSQSAGEPEIHACCCNGSAAVGARHASPAGMITFIKSSVGAATGGVRV